MKPSKTIREMDSSKLLKEFESVVNEYGGKRYDSLGEVMPRYNQNKIKMMRTELFRRLGLVEEDENIPSKLSVIEAVKYEDLPLELQQTIDRVKESCSDKSIRSNINLSHLNKKIEDILLGK